ncbi:hypothetical protein EVAR_101408_1 [Eumeta japonica]|uniref:Uncharacterized protein n=1 Tax=Eumeta variegata TaxID=151549 RepID=A0A4C1TG90_EUMVA|nr:hypothetical protein EVAR_101408_1 [Eumeta japonica]
MLGAHVNARSQFSERLWLAFVDRQHHLKFSCNPVNTYSFIAYDHSHHNRNRRRFSYKTPVDTNPLRLDPATHCLSQSKQVHSSDKSLKILLSRNPTRRSSRARQLSKRYNALFGAVATSEKVVVQLPDKPRPSLFAPKVERQGVAIHQD